jgi:chitosanase
MRETQDQFFDEFYWQTAARIAGNFGITSALGTAVVYDSTVQGSWKTLRDLTIAEAGSFTALGEKQWIAAYVKKRHAWLSNHRRDDLRKTAYRMDCFQRLIDQGYWGLELPLVIRGAEISQATLRATPPGCYDGPQPGTRAIALQSPLARGLDVRLLQLGLSEHGVPIKADGIFGQTSANLLRQFQATEGLPATGVADAALIGRLIS